MIIWAMICWKTLAPGINVDITLTLPKNCSDPIKAMAFSNGSGVF